MSETTYYNKLKSKNHALIMSVYDITEHFPKEEKYGSAQQLRRASVSIMLNYLEEFGRINRKLN